METTLYTLDEAADRLSVSYWTVRRLIAGGELRAVRVSKRGVRVDSRDLAAYVDGLREQARAAEG
ncbi:helix-turn-helix domain-containing protein [Candidatus Poribacteria bacterium]|jgi:excisionase family DNA binding protein|nr:helix-turn-helix domain-containing protein [Candidatus Poribacteria bacterium]